jgi:hypothetical protein
MDSRALLCTEYGTEHAPTIRLEHLTIKYYT